MCFLQYKKGIPFWKVEYKIIQCVYGHIDCLISSHPFSHPSFLATHVYSYIWKIFQKSRLQTSSVFLRYYPYQAVVSCWSFIRRDRQQLATIILIKKSNIYRLMFQRII